MILTIILIILVVPSTALLFSRDIWGLGVFGWVISGCLILTIFFMSLATTGSARQMETFYYDNAIVLQEAYELTRNGVPWQDADGARFIDANGLTNLQQIQKVAESIERLRYQTAKYNGKLRSHRYWQDHPVTSWVFINVDDNLRPLNTGVLEAVNGTS